MLQRAEGKRATPLDTALRIVTALLMAQAVIRAGITVYLWSTFPASANDRSTVIVGFIALWVPLTTLNIVAALGIARRKAWGPLCGLAVCGIGAVIDACFMYVTVGYWTSETSPDWDFFDLVLWTSSALYVAVYCVSVLYLARDYRAGSRAA
jgi:hypothetical protein